MKYGEGETERPNQDPCRKSRKRLKEKGEKM